MKQLVGFEDGQMTGMLTAWTVRTKQASRLWNKHMDSKLTLVHYHSIPSDTAVYVRCSKTGVVILAIHVDNIMSFATPRMS